MLSDQLFLFDAIGTFTFAEYGGYLALRNKFDIFGISVCAMLTASGGGMVRDVILQRTPTLFTDSRYLICIAAGIILVIFSKHFFERWQRIFLVFDAIGLVVFAYIGSVITALSGGSTIAIVVLGTLTAVGGGLLRDIVLRVQPEIMHRDIYASIAVLLSTIFAVMHTYNAPALNSYVFVIAVLLAGLLIRMYIMEKNLHLWKPE